MMSLKYTPYSLCGEYDNIFPSMTFTHYKNLFQDILTGKYRFRPLEYRTYPLSYKNEFMETVFPDYPDCDIYEDDKTFVVIKASNLEDSFVLKAMSVFLQRLIYGKIYIGEYQLKSRYPVFLKTLSAMKCVERIYKIDLIEFGVPLEGFINAVRPFIGDDKYVSGLLISMLGSPIYSKDGDRIFLAQEVTPLGEVNNLIMNMVLMDRFDRVFAKLFPNHRFLRFLHEIFIFDEEIYLDDESEEKSTSSFYKELSSFFQNIGVKGFKCQLITRGKGSLVCREDIHYPPEKILAMIAPCGQVIV